MGYVITEKPMSDGDYGYSWDPRVPSNDRDWDWEDLLDDTCAWCGSLIRDHDDGECGPPPHEHDDGECPPAWEREEEAKSYLEYEQYVEVYLDEEGRL